MFDQNLLLFGDNLGFLSDPEEFPSESVDLIYLDPPFNSNASYNVLFKDVSGDPSPAQIKAFDDTWSWDASAAEALASLMHSQHSSNEVKALIRTFHTFLGHSPMLAYLVQMAVRLVHLRRVLKPTGALYLHCDPTASHYLKLVLDGVFAPECFLNEIIWPRTLPKSLMTRRLPNNHDTILSYGRTVDTRLNEDALFIPYDLENLDDKTLSQYSHIDTDGQRYQLTSLLNPNKDRPNLTYSFLGVTRVWRWTQ